jgi:predicted metal-dependent phosphoesterase TrpH
MMPIDLHSHSTASDGTLSPSRLIRLAHDQGVGTLALTDHDSTAGLEEARQAATSLGLKLVPGVEISVTWASDTVHIVGLNIDPTHERLQQGLARLTAVRAWRAEEIGKRLMHCGIKDALTGARAHAVGSSITRTHFARFLVENGHVRSTQEAFKRFLGRGMPGHVPTHWASLEEAVAWIAGAGGQAVIAHPARYKLTRRRFHRLFSEFKECGGTGIEVNSGSHTREERLVMAHYAKTFGLLAGSGSDYHGPGQSWTGLGQLPPLPAGCTPIWDSWNPE